MTAQFASGTTRPRRSVLYMPASNTRVLEKAKGLAADGLILDLEDAVSPAAKSSARAAAVAASGMYGAREVLIRVNARDTPWAADDLAAVATSRAHGVLLAKVSTSDDVRAADNALSAAGAPDSLKLWAMMETPQGVLNAADVAGATSRLAGFVVGTNDLAKDLHCAHPADRAPMLYALQHCVLVARAHGLAVLDGVHIDVDDDAGLVAACKQGRALGFDGKTLIHPKQIDAANTVFAPSPDDLARAQRIVVAHSAARAEGQEVIVLDGRLVEALHVREAERLIAQAEAIARLEAQRASPQ
jgi:citrate lyase subunit beta/citryl-CoA lyase